MPIYEYRCAECGFQKEFLQRISDAPLRDCPECGKASFGKMVTAAGFQLKGSGWYATDFRNNGAKPAAKTESGADGGKSAASDAGTSSGTAASDSGGTAAAACGTNCACH